VGVTETNDVMANALTNNVRMSSGPGLSNETPPLTLRSFLSIGGLSATMWGVVALMYYWLA
jgi:hypothetical protein